MPHAPTWAKMTIPPTAEMILPAQQVASSLAVRYGFDAQRQKFFELAVEELVRIVLTYSFDDGRITEGELTIEFCIEPPLFRINVVEFGLPFDLSMVPEIRDAADLDSESAIPGLSICLLKHNAEHCRIVNNGREGIRLEVAWFLPGEHIGDVKEEEQPEPGEAHPPEDVESIRLLDDTFAMQIARLVFRCYGYSYVYADIYYPDRVRAYNHSGLLTSWGAVTPSGRLAGHLALMKESVESGALEWGLAVVDPLWRGRGLMESMLHEAMDHAARREERVLFAHAVTAHPYTQKTCCRFGFHPVALLLGYASASLRFKGISNGLKQRESTFLTVRCTHPLPRQTLFLPRRHAAVLRSLLAVLEPALPGEYLLEGDDQADVTDRATQYAVSTASCINVGRIQIAGVGADCGQVVWRETRRLCREGLDVIYLTVDLADPGAARLVHEAERNGYILAGLTPMMRPAYGLTLQFLSGCQVDFAAIQTHGELAGWLKEQVAREYHRMEAADPLLTYTEG